MPFWRFRIETPLSLPEVRDRLSPLIRPRRKMLKKIEDTLMEDCAKNPPFEGAMNPTSFAISPAVNYRNSFLPRIHGSIVQHPDNTEVNVIMSIQPLTALFSAFWLLGFGSKALSSLRSSPGFSIETMVPAVLFGFFLLVLLVGFFPEASKARHLLTRALNDTSA